MTVFHRPPVHISECSSFTQPCPYQADQSSYHGRNQIAFCLSASPTLRPDRRSWARKPGCGRKVGKDGRHQLLSFPGSRPFPSFPRRPARAVLTILRLGISIRLCFNIGQLPLNSRHKCTVSCCSRLAIYHVYSFPKNKSTVAQDEQI